jgi:hypothetical protein
MILKEFPISTVLKNIKERTASLPVIKPLKIFGELKIPND